MIVDRKAGSIEELQMNWTDPYMQWYAAGMPTFVTRNLEPWKQITVKFKTKEDRLDFGRKANYELTDKTGVVWYPEKKRERNNMNRVVEDE